MSLSNVAYWDLIEDTWLAFFAFHVFHSLWMCFILPHRLRVPYAMHILLDILSHTGYWSIRPLLTAPIPGVFDAWKLMIV